MNQKGQSRSCLDHFFPRLEVIRICGMTWQQVIGLAAAVADVLHEDRVLLERFRAQL